MIGVSDGGAGDDLGEGRVDSDRDGQEVVSPIKSTPPSRDSVFSTLIRGVAEYSETGGSGVAVVGGGTSVGLGATIMSAVS